VTLRRRSDSQSASYAVFHMRASRFGAREVFSSYAVIQMGAREVLSSYAVIHNNAGMSSGNLAAAIHSDASIPSGNLAATARAVGVPA